MKVKFITLRLQADDSGLIVLHLPTAATMTVKSPQVWLTHSLSNQDHVLEQGTTLSLMAGTVLIEGDAALVEVQAQKTSVFKELTQRASLWFKEFKVSTCAVCVRGDITS